MTRTIGWVVVLGLALPAVVRGQLPAEDIKHVEPAGVLVMPFDATSGKVSFQIVSRLGPPVADEPLRTHWVYWAADCRHLADVTIQLTNHDTVVADPTHVQGQFQEQLTNVPIGPSSDLSGERGVVIVTAADGSGAVSPQIAGAWTIADVASSAAFGADAIGVSDGGVLAGQGLLAEGVVVQTFNPRQLDRSEVILIGIEGDAGNVTPIRRASGLLDGGHVCCSTNVTDNLEGSISAPNVCFACAAFLPITADLAVEGETALVPGSPLGSAGFVHLTSCQTANADGSLADLGDGDDPQLLLVFHGQSVGRFGTVISGRYPAGGLEALSGLAD